MWENSHNELGKSFTLGSDGFTGQTYISKFFSDFKNNYCIERMARQWDITNSCSQFGRQLSCMKTKMKPSTAHYTTIKVKKGERIANRPADDDPLQLS